MSIKFTVPEDQDAPDLKPKITVVGVGGAGGNAVNNMIESQLEGVEFMVTNTDHQSLEQNLCERRLQLGTGTTAGLGAGSKPQVGEAAAEECIQEITDQLKGSNMVFITAGMGGGTGTGAAPVIARTAREQGILTVGVVTKPFHFEGSQRMAIADRGIEELQQYVDTLIIIPNQNLFRIANEKTTFADAFKMADDVLYSGVRSITDLIVKPGIINLDFADIRTVMGEMGKAMMGTGEAEGEKRALDAAEVAISNPLLEDTSVNGAKGVLISITGGPDMTLFEVDEAANRIRDEVDSNAQIIIGTTFDPNLEGKVRISVVATGIDAESVARPIPTRVLDATRLEPVAEPAPQAVEPEAAFESTDVFAEEEPLAIAEPEEAEAETEAFPVEEPEIAVEQPQAQETEAEAPEEPVAEETPEPEAPAVPEQAAKPAEPPFIPPAPAEPKSTAVATDEVDPFAAADMTNGAAQDEPKMVEPAPMKAKGPSLFERVTGTGRAKKNTQPAVKPEPSVIRGGLSTQEPEKTEEQPTLGGVTTSELPITSQADDELLDIPAFLRRQAN